MYSLIQHVVRHLNENKNATYKYSNTQIPIPNDIAEKILAFSLAIPDEKIYTDPNDPSYGRELEPHVTIKYGLETTNAEDVKKLLTGNMEKIKVLLKKVTIFESDEKPYDVVKIDVESSDLNELHNLFCKLPNKETHPTYIPHLTIAYVKKGVGAEFVGKEDFDGTTFEVDSFFFKGSDGNATLINLKS